MMNSFIYDRNIYFEITGLISFALAVFQISAIFWSPTFLMYFGGPVRLQSTNYLLYILVCILASIILILFGVYSLSGAGIFPVFPLLNPFLFIIGGVYILRGLLIIPNLISVSQSNEISMWRFVIFSLFALSIGIIQILGILKLFNNN